MGGCVELRVPQTRTGRGIISLSTSLPLLPPSHPQRQELNDEAHARPPETLTAPVRISYLALYGDSSLREGQLQHIAGLAARFGVKPPAPGAIHYSANMGRFRLKWERHSEFARYKFIISGTGEDPFADPPIRQVPPEWLAGLTGQTLTATHAAFLPLGDAQPDYDAISGRLFAGNPLIGSAVAGGAGIALTDLRIRPDGFSRLLVLDKSLRPRQAGRALQRLLEIDTYRLLALLTLPVARQLTPALAASEHELADITSALVGVAEAGEPQLLDRLTRLAAQIESFESQNNYRFSAGRAYYQLVQQRIAELREERIVAIQTFREFTELRLAPAMNTCSVTALRLESLSSRVARATQLLSTRVDVSREQQSIAVLESMNERADLQLRLQQTVEGLSVAAITYYIIGLIGYAARGVQAGGVKIDPDMAMGIAIPFVILAVAMGIRRIHHKVLHASAGKAHK
ncbi:MAG: hypothetical protein B7Z77_01630 [Acidocella sp. 20-58-15]|nr:MAG: hypothetical protein B7Z77_01630 [Acidocella sp. 20-58-15]